MQEDIFPQPSIAVHCRSILPVPLHSCVTMTSVYPVNVGPHWSVAEKVPVTAGSLEDSHDMVIFVGQVISGGVLSWTVINCVPVAKLLQASCAVQVRTIVPVPLHPVRPKTLSLKVMIMSSGAVQLSDAVATPVNPVPVFCSHDTVIEGGSVNMGFVLSTMTMVCIQTASFPHMSVAFQCLVNVPVPLHPPRFWVLS